MRSLTSRWRRRRRRIRSPIRWRISRNTSSRLSRRRQPRPSRHRQLRQNRLVSSSLRLRHSRLCHHHRRRWRRRPRSRPRLPFRSVVNGEWRSSPRVARFQPVAEMVLTMALPPPPPPPPRARSHHRRNLPTGVRVCRPCAIGTGLPRTPLRRLRHMTIRAFLPPRMSAPARR